ncbi:CbtB-domain containing protein [Leptospira fletcheri]|uniref:CbtB-domain containing protein n=1 Tax=Leptospira fletcheri TaxID=2484981 RepID=A0A4R9GIN6_9LEPT|nr:CbtB domain-containing protein [Leptospira fletcheri]TGK12006.1 CbtB-domain containing protein [Leptospira fletcheri]
MRTVSLLQNSLQRISANWNSLFLIFGISLFAFGAIYIVALEPMQAVHDTFHDLRHAAGFPCH